MMHRNQDISAVSPGMKVRVCHLTSVHKQDDIRVFRKQLVSLSRAGYDAYLVSEGDSGERDGVHLIGLGRIPASRISRMLFFTRKVYRAGLALNADVYQIHDPELLPAALKLKRKGKTVIFDSHENVSGQIAEKTWLPGWIRKLVAACYGAYEKRVGRRLDAIICVSPNFTERMKQINPCSVTVTNYPLPEERALAHGGNRMADQTERDSGQSDRTEQRDAAESRDCKEAGRNIFTLCFPGLISEEWCHLEILDALLLLNQPGSHACPAQDQTEACSSSSQAHGETMGVRYRLCGPFHEAYLTALKNHPGWQYVTYEGVVPRSQVAQMIRESDAGMALARKCANTDHQIGTLGNTKLFEYMLQKKVMICTDFELWKAIVEREQCGLTVEPTDPVRIAEAVRALMLDPEQSVVMGENGYRAVMDTYNWNEQEIILTDLYRMLTSNLGGDPKVSPVKAGVSR